VQFTEILALTKAGPPPWSPAFTRQLGQVLDAEIVIPATPLPAALEEAPAPGGRWQFTHIFQDAGGNPAGHARVLLTPPPTVRAMLLFQRISALLLCFALLLLVVLLLLMLIDRRWFRTEDTDAAPTEGFTVLKQIAARSARQSVELELERSERQRAEADNLLNQILLNRALQEKIDMGRDLHDGLIQSLYATGLTIQAGRKSIIQDPTEARSQLETALQTLNTAIREVRQYISGLAPEQLQQRSFAESVRTLSQDLAAGRTITFDLRIDEEAARHLSATQSTDLLQIIRESISNSLRHGGSSHIAVRLHRHGNSLALLIQDNGSGFDLKKAERGHGLDNMQARAARLGASLRCHSETSTGTRTIVEFTAAPAPDQQ
jgi:signal transduction histidine kinase